MRWVCQGHPQAIMNSPCIKVALFVQVFRHFLFQTPGGGGPVVHDFHGPPEVCPTPAQECFFRDFGIRNFSWHRLMKNAAGILMFPARESFTMSASPSMTSSAVYLLAVINSPRVFSMPTTVLFLGNSSVIRARTSCQFAKTGGSGEGFSAPLQTGSSEATAADSATAVVTATGVEFVECPQCPLWTSTESGFLHKKNFLS